MHALLVDLARRAPVRFEVVAVNIDQGHPGYPGHLLTDYMAARRPRVPDGRRGHLLDRHRQDPRGKDVLLALLAPPPRHPLPPRRASSAAPRSRSATTATTRSRRCCSTSSSPASSRRCRRSSSPTTATTWSSARSSTAPRTTSPRSPPSEGFPILPCDLCGSQDNLQRKAMSRLLAELDARFPGARQNMLAALGNVRPSHLFDKGLWEQLGLEVAREGDRGTSLADDRPAPEHRRAPAAMRGQAPHARSRPRTAPSLALPAARAAPATRPRGGARQRARRGAPRAAVARFDAWPARGRAPPGDARRARRLGDHGRARGLRPRLAEPARAFAVARAPWRLGGPLLAACGRSLAPATSASPLFLGARRRSPGSSPRPPSTRRASIQCAPPSAPSRGASSPSRGASAGAARKRRAGSRRARPSGPRPPPALAVPARRSRATVVGIAVLPDLAWRVRDPDRALVGPGRGRRLRRRARAPPRRRSPSRARDRRRPRRLTRPPDALDLRVARRSSLAPRCLRRHGAATRGMTAPLRVPAADEVSCRACRAPSTSSPSCSSSRPRRVRLRRLRARATTRTSRRSTSSSSGASRSRPRPSSSARAGELRERPAWRHACVAGPRSPLACVLRPRCATDAARPGPRPGRGADAPGRGRARRRATRSRRRLGRAHRGRAARRRSRARATSPIRDALFAAEARAARPRRVARTSAPRSARSSPRRVLRGSTRGGRAAGPVTDDELAARPSATGSRSIAPKGFRTVHAVVRIDRTPTRPTRTRRASARRGDPRGRRAVPATRPAPPRPPGRPAEAAGRSRRRPRSSKPPRAVPAEGFEVVVEALPPVAATGRLLTLEPRHLRRCVRAAAASLTARGELSPVVATRTAST